MLDDRNHKWGAFSLAQRRMDEGLYWLQQSATACGAVVKDLTLERTLDDLPDHALAHGARFDAIHPQRRQELAAYYHNTLISLQPVVASTPGASPIHIWPHQFDMTTSIPLSPTPEGIPRSMGVGFSPGNGGYDQPYWYVTLWPYSQSQSLPDLAGGGTWHTAGWVGGCVNGNPTETRRPSTAPGESVSAICSRGGAIAANG